MAMLTECPVPGKKFQFFDLVAAADIVTAN